MPSSPPHVALTTFPSPSIVQLPCSGIIFLPTCSRWGLYRIDSRASFCSCTSVTIKPTGRNAFLQSFCPKPPMLPPPPRPPAAQVPFIKPFIFDNVQYLTRHTTFEPLWIPFSMSARHAASPDMQQALAPARHVASPPHGCGTRHAPCLFPCSTFSTPVPTPHPPVVPPPAHRGCPPVVPPALCPVAGEHLVCQGDMLRHARVCWAWYTISL